MNLISDRVKLFSYNNLSDSDSRKHNVFASMALSGNKFIYLDAMLLHIKMNPLLPGDLLCPTK